VGDINARSAQRQLKSPHQVMMGNELQCSALFKAQAIACRGWWLLFLSFSLLTAGAFVPGFFRVAIRL
jgi:hypothetical protein